MFTGIIEKTGLAQRLGSTLKVWTDLATELGDSVAVNGVCLTVREQSPNSWKIFDLADATLVATTFGIWPASPDSDRPTRRVNLERALRVGGRLGGHWVQGHVDAPGVVLLAGRHLKIQVPTSVARFCVTKGSLAIDGVSLTLQSVEALPTHEIVITTELIPHTLFHTQLGELRPGDVVNLEADLLARYALGVLPPEVTWTRT